MLNRFLCETCGGALNKVDEAHYACRCCGNVYSVEKIENYADKISKLFNGAKLELIANAKKNLYNAITSQYISSEEVHECCSEIKKYLPDDFQANFYDDFINKPKREVPKKIREINVNEHFECLEPLIVFIIKSLEKSYVAAVKDLIERAYKLKGDNNKYVKYTTMVENEAEKLDMCVYDTKQPRKAFIAYSSKDSDKAIELVEVLEGQGISCFISLRNLRHGVGSQENYDRALKDAMDHCMSFVFVSSMNSRNIECDAYEIEMPYVMQRDIDNAPGQYRNYYSRIPQEYKKPRVEYRIQESIYENFADDLVDEFFDGYERAYTIKDVALRIMRQSRAMDRTLFEASEAQTVIESSKVQINSFDALLKRVYLFLEDEEFDRADDFCEQVLNGDPENAEAYICKLLSEFKCRTRDELSTLAVTIKNSKNYAKVIRFGDASQIAYVKGAEENIQNALQRKREEEWKKQSEALKRQQEEEKRKKAEELKRQQEEEARKKAEALKRQQEEEARKKAEELKRQQEEEALKTAEALRFKQNEEKKKLEKVRLQAESEYKKGLAYAHGQGVTQNYYEAVKWYKLAADKGLAEAQNNLGFCYENGNGVTIDYNEAVKWYRCAAEQGLAEAQYNLGLCYEDGHGVAPNRYDAAKWYELAAKQGLAGAQNNLAICYYHGIGKYKSYAEAAKWYTLAAKQGVSNAQYNLGWCYAHGQGVTKDYAEAAKWYELAAEQGNEDAKKEYKKIKWKI